MARLQRANTFTFARPSRPTPSSRRRVDGVTSRINTAENLQSRDEYARLRDEVSGGAHLMLAQLQHDEMISLDDVASLGFDLSLVGVTALQAYISILQTTADSLVETGTATDLAPFDEVKRVVGFDELLAFEEKYNCC